MKIQSLGLDRLAGKTTSILVFDCEFWHLGSIFLPREIGGYHLIRTGNSWTRASPFFVVFPPPPNQLNRVSSKFSTVTPKTSQVLDLLEETERSAPEFLRNNDSVQTYFADPLIKPHLKLKPTGWLKDFIQTLKSSTVIVKGHMDLKAIQSACSHYEVHYQTPLKLVDIALQNPQFSKRCGTAKLEGTYRCISHELDAGLKKAFPVGKAHTPVSDAAMTLQIAAWLSEKDMR